ncbi:MAG TPA: PaaI family thioesterase [Mycobacteriales bacterium]|nr:PaaI family thioesterase [Mycobacteriales bacterium]
MTDQREIVDPFGAQSGFQDLIGLQIVEAGPDRVAAELEIRPDLLQPYGIVHGGVLCTVVETVGSVAAAIWYGDRGQVVGVANSTDFIRATRSGRLSGLGTPIHRGRTSQLWLVEVTDGDGRLVARGQLRVANIENADRLGHAAGGEAAQDSR